MKQIAIIGRPNVGKSSFFNRLAKQRDAITSDLAGTTRDTKKREVEILDTKALLVDTGGLDSGCELYTNIKEHSLVAAKESDILLYIVDGKEMPQDIDREFFYDILKLKKPTALVVNKIDNDKEKERAWNFVAFGSEHLFDISISHNRGVNRLLEWIYSYLDVEKIEIVEDKTTLLEEFLDEDELKRLDDEEMERRKREAEIEDSEIKVAIIGRVNVGKSSLLNALVDKNRSIVSSIAGTTIDPVDEVICENGVDIRFVDTAGIRKRGKIDGIERYALDRTQKMLERADIAILVLDASVGFVDLDEKIGGLVDRYKLGCIVVFNKWDIKCDEFKKLEESFRYKFKYLSYVPILTISANTKRHIDKLKEKIFEVHKNYSRRIPTSELNDLIAQAQNRHRLPGYRGKNVKIYYATQYSTKPPKVALISNRPEGIHFSYKRYLTNFIREHYDFEGVFLSVEAKGRGLEDDDSQKSKQ